MFWHFLILVYIRVDGIEGVFTLLTCAIAKEKSQMRILFSLTVLVALSLPVIGQNQGGIQVDPNTGRAVGAKEISPEELRSHIDQKTKLLIIDVREPEAFRKETIKGAVNIPLDRLESRFKDIPKGTMLVFT